MSKSRQIIVPASIGVLLAAAHAGAMTINIHPEAGLAGNTAALAAFNRAAASWSSLFSDNITITIDADLNNTNSDFVGNSSIIGETGSYSVTQTYASFRTHMVTDAATSPSNAIVAALPATISSANVTLPSGYTLSGNVNINTAEAKALGYTVNTTYDATMTFNSNFNFDYDSSNGVTAGSEDFQSVATHEIGHALGFVSAVDTVDIDKHNGATAASITLDPMDLFRFQSGSAPTNAATFATATRYLDTSSASVFSDASTSYLLSTGQYTGDGNQASHWKADEITGNYIGIMDPTIAYGTSESITSADTHFFDLLGYDLVPEPTLLGVASLVIVPMLRRRR